VKTGNDIGLQNNVSKQLKPTVFTRHNIAQLGGGHEYIATRHRFNSGVKF